MRRSLASVAILGAAALAACGGSDKKATQSPDDSMGGTEAAGGGDDQAENKAAAPADPYAEYAPLDVGADWASWPKLNKQPVLSKTHGHRFVDTYVNDVGREAYKDDDADIPVGTVIVKTSFENQDGKPSEVAGPIFIMKRVAGENGGEPTWWYGLHWEKVPEKWQKAMGGSQAYWRTPSEKVGYCDGCHDNFPRELGGIPKEARSW